MAAPTSVTKMTGFFNNERGFSFLNESITACAMISRSKREWVLTATLLYLPLQ